MTSNDLSRALVRQLKRVNRLRKVSHPDALEYAQDCVETIVPCSWHHSVEEQCTRDRPSDEIADALWYRIPRLRVKAGHHQKDLELTEVYEDLRELSRDVGSSIGDEDFLSKSLGYLRSQPSVKETFHNRGTKIV